jgi:hypothetical protein
MAASQSPTGQERKRSQSHYNALEIAQRPFETLIEDGPLAGALERCETAPDDVNSEDWKRCSTYYFMQANAWEYLYYQNRDGTIPPEFWEWRRPTLLYSQ